MVSTTGVSISSDSPMVRLSFVDFLGELHLFFFSETILLCLLN